MTPSSPLTTSWIEITKRKKERKKKRERERERREKMVEDHQSQEEVRKGPWTEQEDFQLVCFVGLFGDRRWDFIAKVSGLKVAGDT